MDIGLGFQKTNLRIRINILEILSLCVCMCVCVYVCVCVCVCANFQAKQMTFSDQISPKNGFSIGSPENYCWNKNHYPRDTLPIFRQNEQL